MECRYSSLMFFQEQLLFSSNNFFETASPTIFKRISVANFNYAKHPNGLTIWVIIRDCMDHVLYVLTLSPSRAHLSRDDELGRAPASSPPTSTNPHIQPAPTLSLPELPDSPFAAHSAVGSCASFPKSVLKVSLIGVVVCLHSFLPKSLGAPWWIGGVALQTWLRWDHWMSRQQLVGETRWVHRSSVNRVLLLY